MASAFEWRAAPARIGRRTADWQAVGWAALALAVLATAGWASDWQPPADLERAALESARARVSGAWYDQESFEAELERRAAALR
jgi:hypothetical protein